MNDLIFSETISDSKCDKEIEEGNGGALKQCPFCGATPDIFFRGSDRTTKRSVIVKCLVCRVQRTESGRISTMATLTRYAIKNWNTRYP